MIYQAPGKVVFWGEYAVLAGAPSAIMAIDRYAQVELNTRPVGWLFSSRGFTTPGIDKHTPTFSDAPAAKFSELALAHWGYTELPSAFQVCSDSSDFFAPQIDRQPRQKLGIGSSAAVCTATYLALAEHLHKTPSLAEALAIHHRFQGNKGSGLDVAASWHGGFIRYQENTATPINWPENLHWRVIWTGTSASTGRSLTNFAKWREQSSTATLTALSVASSTLCNNISLTNIGAYTDCLRALDEAAQLNIFTHDHQRLATIATAHDLIYKPCGAGGGDIGLACGADAKILDAFCATVATENYLPLNLETAPNGVKAC